MATPKGFEQVTVDVGERKIIRLALRRYAAELDKEQKRNKERGASNPIFDQALQAIRGTGNLGGLLARFRFDSDQPDEEETEKGKKASDPRQMSIPGTVDREVPVGRVSPVREPRNRVQRAEIRP